MRAVVRGLLVILRSNNHPVQVTLTQVILTEIVLSMWCWRVTFEYLPRKAPESLTGCKSNRFACFTVSTCIFMWESETSLYSLGRESNVYSQHESVCLLFPFTVYRNLGHFPNQEQCMNYGPWMLTGLNFPYVLSLPPTSLAVPFHTFPSLL